MLILQTGGPAAYIRDTYRPYRKRPVCGTPRCDRLVIIYRQALMKTMKIKDLCHDERPREKMMSKGAEALSNAELLAILLRTGTGGQNVVETAQKLLGMAGGKLSDLSEMPATKMCSICGIGSSKAITVSAARERGKRAAIEASNMERVSITGPEMVFNRILPRLKSLKHEECWVMYLNRANYIIATEKASSGGLEATVVDIKIIVRNAIEKLASSIILIHNHPSGNPTPGTADISLTGKLKKALETFDISLIDHIIVCDDRYYSFSDERIVPAR